MIDVYKQATKIIKNLDHEEKRYYRACYKFGERSDMKVCDFHYKHTYKKKLKKLKENDKKIEQSELYMKKLIEDINNE